MKRAVLLFLMVALLSPPPSALAAEQITPNGIQRIGAGECALFEVDCDYSAVNVAVVDTGIDLRNPDLNVVGGVDCSPQMDPGLPFSMQNYDFRATVVETEEFAHFGNPLAAGYDDGYGHGTHVSGIIAARDNGVGVVGVAPNASLWSVKVLDNNGGGTDESVICGLQWIHENRHLVDVVNMSLGGASLALPDELEDCDQQYEYAPVYLPQPDRKISDPEHKAICQLYDDGIPVVVAAGNSPNSAVDHRPAGYGEVLTVSAFVDNDGLPGGLGGRNTPAMGPCQERFGGHDDMFYGHHNFTPERQLQFTSGKPVDLAAPGICVLSWVPGQFGPSLVPLTGTSMAAPHVTGVVAVYIHNEWLDGASGRWFRTMRDGAFTSLLMDTIIAAGERQDTGFRDVDQYLEPIVSCGWCA